MNKPLGTEQSDQASEERPNSDEFKFPSKSRPTNAGAPLWRRLGVVLNLASGKIKAAIILWNLQNVLLFFKPHSHHNGLYWDHQCP